MLAADLKAAIPEFVPHPANPVEGEGEMDLVHGGHEGQIVPARPDRLVVHARTGEAQKAGLSGDGHGMAPIDHRLALVPFTRPSAADKKSFSIVSPPILA